MKSHWLVQIHDTGDGIWRSKEITVNGQSYGLMAALPQVHQEMLVNNVYEVRITRLPYRTRDDSIMSDSVPH